MIKRAIGRLILVPLGFILASLTTAFVLVTLGMERVTQTMARRDWDFFDVFSNGTDALLQTQLISSATTFLPAIILIVIGEVARIRSSMFYVVGGGLALAAIPMLTRFGYADGAMAPTNAVWQVFTTAGFAGGFVYWLIAGRKA